jgi:hypothetical protein
MRHLIKSVLGQFRADLQGLEQDVEAAVTHGRLSCHQDDGGLDVRQQSLCVV